MPCNVRATASTWMNKKKHGKIYAPFHVDVNDGFYSNASTVDEVTATYSKYRGRCYTSYSEKKVRSTHATLNGKIVNAVS